MRRLLVFVVTTVMLAAVQRPEPVQDFAAAATNAIGAVQAHNDI